MPQFFAILDGHDRRGPFATLGEAVAVVKDVSLTRGHSLQQAHDFFLRDSAVEEVDIINGREERLMIGWLAREEFQVEPPGRDRKVEIFSATETARQRADAEAEAHFTTAARKAAEVNEGGIAES